MVRRRIRKVPASLSGLPENEIAKLNTVEAAKHGMTLYQNNSGALFDKTGRLVRFGLGNDKKSFREMNRSSDKIGFLQVEITPDMVGKTVAIYCAIEDKTPDFKFKKEYKKYSREWLQKNYLRVIHRAGGIANFCRSPDDMRRIIKGYLKWLKS